MARRESAEFNFVGLARSPVKRTPHESAPGLGDINADKSNYSAATTERVSIGSTPSTAGSVRFMAPSSASASHAGAASSSRHHQPLQPMSDNNLLGASTQSCGTANTPSPSSPLDMMASQISSKRKALAARRSSLSVSRTLKLTPVSMRQREQESVGARTRQHAADGGGMLHSNDGDYTHDSITQSALLSALDRSSPAPPDSTPQTPYTSDEVVASSASSINRRGLVEHGSHSSHMAAVADCQDQPLTPEAACGETGFLVGGDISDIDGDRSRAWSASSFTNAVFSPDPATPAVACVGGISNGNSSGREGKTKTGQDKDVNRASSRTSEIGTSYDSSRGVNNGHNTTSSTPAAVSALLNMGGHSDGVMPTPRDYVPVSRYRGYMTSSSIALSTPGERECDGGKGRGELPNTPAAAATLAAMMMGVEGKAGGKVGGRGARSVEGGQEVGVVEEEGAETGEDEQSLPRKLGTGVQVQQSRKSTPETQSHLGGMGTRLPIITPRRRRAASQLVDMSKATPRHMIRGILGGSGRPYQQHQRFVPQVTKLVENVEEETPRALLRGVCGRKDDQPSSSNGSRCTSASVAQAAAAAAAAAAATAAAAVAESEKREGDIDNTCGKGRTSGSLGQVIVEPSCPALPPAKGTQKGFLRTAMIILVLVILLCGVWVVVRGVVVVVCLAFAGPTLAHPIY